VTARDEILARIGRALTDTVLEDTMLAGTVLLAAGDDVPRRYRTHADLETPGLLDLLTERLNDYGSIVRRATPGQAGAAVGEALGQRGATRIVVPPGPDLAGLADLPGLPGGIAIITDDGLSPAELDAVDGVITAAAVAIAETGTIVLDGSPGQGRRVLSLVPDYHLCILRADQVVGLVPEALARLTPGRPLTWISGPSATSDIELDRVQGVHGPRTLEVILVEPGP
jgi:L-lactate dehydrogenase complex protein LldG